MWFNGSDAHVNGIRLENAGPVSGSVFTNLPAFIPSQQQPCEGGSHGPRAEMRNVEPKATHVSCRLATNTSCVCY